MPEGGGGGTGVGVGGAVISSRGQLEPVTKDRLMEGSGNKSLGETIFGVIKTPELPTGSGSG